MRIINQNNWNVITLLLIGKDKICLQIISFSKAVIPKSFIFHSSLNNIDADLCTLKSSPIIKINQFWEVNFRSYFLGDYPFHNISRKLWWIFVCLNSNSVYANLRSWKGSIPSEMLKGNTSLFNFRVLSLSDAHD